ncbi:MAG: outer membrane beta-barrel protein, partial [Bacteroidota bacterium]|nr:outer membrane beta-barrel protein [Bacteroidota bacterium]
MKNIFRISLIIGLFWLISTAITAQVTKTNFKGIIHDESNQPIPGATLMILHAADSVLAQFASSDVQGAFNLKNVPKGDYLLNITFLGLEPIYQPITSGISEEVDLGNIKMTTQAKVLSEVKVMADIIPIEITKDTISYNADAFQTQPNAVVEDLLKKLPGIEVASDGSIKAQGEDVQKIYVDGKEFFGTDPKMATKNLPARAIKKVKVYDKQSDMAEFTGVDDGTREKTIDLQLKEEFKKGLFGKAQAGYGSDGRYNASATLNRFNKDLQLSFLGQLNNINEQGFSFNDVMNFSGGMRGMGGGGGRNMEFRAGGDLPINNGTSSGQVETAAGGINFNWNKTKKFDLRSSYFFNSVDKSLEEIVFRQNLSDNPFDTDEDMNEVTDNKSHRFSLNTDIKFDTTQQIDLSARLGFGNATGLSSTFLQNSIPGGSVQSESQSDENNTNNNLSLTASSTYMKKLGSTGRNASVSLTYTDNDQDNDGSLKALTELFTTGSTEALDQLQYANSATTQWETQLSYTEPLKKRKFLEFNYYYNQAESAYDKDVFDIVNTSPVPNSSLSNQYTSLFSYHRPGVTFRYSGQIHNINVGMQYQFSELNGHLNQDENEINKKYGHFIPRVIWRNDIGNGKNLRISYT